MFRAVRLILPVLLALSAPLSVQAATFIVSKTAGTLDGACDRDCSLREAVTAANADEPTGGADVVVVPPGIYLLTRIGAGECGRALRPWTSAALAPSDAEARGALQPS